MRMFSQQTRAQCGREKVHERVKLRVRNDGKHLRQDILSTAPRIEPIMDNRDADVCEWIAGRHRMCRGRAAYLHGAVQRPGSARSEARRDDTIRRGKYARLVGAALSVARTGDPRV